MLKDAWNYADSLFSVGEGVSAEEALVHAALLLKCVEEVCDAITQQGSGIERGLICPHPNPLQKPNRPHFSSGPILRPSGLGYKARHNLTAGGALSFARHAWVIFQCFFHCLTVLP